MKKNGLWIAGALVVIGLAQSARAQTALQPEASITAQAPANPSAVKRLSANASLTSSSNLHKVGDYEHSADMGLEAMIGYKLDDTYKLGLTLAGSKELTGERKMSLDDGSLAISHAPIELNSTFTAGLALRALLPLSQAARYRSQITTFTLSPKITAASESTGLSISYSLGLGRSLHRYTVSADGSSNSEYVLTNTLAAGWDITEKLSLSAMYQHGSAWTYHGNLRQSFQTSEEIAWAPTAALGLALGLQNGGNVLKPNGTSSNITLFNDQSSVVYTTVSYTY